LKIEEFGCSRRHLIVQCLYSTVAFEMDRYLLAI